MLLPFTPVLILALLATGLALAILAISHFIGPRRPNPVKDSTYESGLTPIGPGQRRVPVRFYLVATLFILFDIEVVFLFPWAVQFRHLARPVAQGGQGMGALLAMGVFITVLFLGYIYVWRKGALEWD
jgi:NADH-quinone oxidoreductase subunit A